MSNEKARAERIRKKMERGAAEEVIRAAYNRSYTGSNQTALSWSAFRGGWRACESQFAAGMALPDGGQTNG
jgi:hypothetical protein